MIRVQWRPVDAERCQMSKKPNSRKPSHDADDATVQVTITLSRDTLRDLDAHAARERRSRSNAADILIENALKPASKAS